MSNPQENQHDQPIDHYRRQAVNTTSNIPHHPQDEREREDPHLQPGDDMLDEQQLQDQDNQMSEQVNNHNNIARHTTTIPDDDYKHALIFDDKELMRRISESATKGTMIKFEWPKEEAKKEPHQTEDDGEGSSKQ
jgi:hypothetical protein